MSASPLRRAALVSAAAAAVAGLARLPAASAGESTNTAGPVRQGSTDGTNRPAVTISFSGQTALRNFNTSPGISTLRPGAVATFDFGLPGSPVPVTYTATNTAATSVQLARSSFAKPDTGVNYAGGAPDDVQGHSALRLEWHEQGSGEGLIDLINDQVGYVGGLAGTPLSNTPSRGPSTSNPTWVNTNQFTAGNVSPSTGLGLAAGNFSNTYDTNVYDRATGKNLQGGQNRIQFSVGEFRTESLSVGGASPSIGVAAGAPGYGLGNPALGSGPTLNGLGSGGARQQFRPQSVANQSADKNDPEQTGTAAYAAGPWATAGSANIDSKQVAVTAVTFSANPGTGLYRLNKGDTQWLQTTGRLQNGANFNVVTRSIDTGQRIVPALATGVDPSWAVGENDDGNTSGSAAAAVQRTIGSGIRFSGKTSGTESREVIAQSRLGIGTLSLAENRGAASNAPVRALDVDFNNDTDKYTTGTTPYGNFTHLKYESIIDFSWKPVLISHYNTIKAANPALLSQYQSSFQSQNGRAPTAAEEQTWWNDLSSAQTGIKGDKLGNVGSFINNISQSIGTAATGLTAASVNNPADSLFISGFLIPQVLQYKRQYDGGPLDTNPLYDSLTGLRKDIKDNYGANFSPDGAAGSNVQTKGSNAFYAVRNPNYAADVNPADQVAITAKNADGTTALNGDVTAPKGNYLFGNFNQDGHRDYASVKESVRAAISLRAADPAGKGSIFQADGGIANAAPVAPAGAGFSDLPSPAPWAGTAGTKGDLIVLGDANADGRFDGKDVYELARGASLSDSGTTDHLTTQSGPTFADQLRNPNAKLNKNAALDYAATKTADATDAAQLYVRTSARAILADPQTGTAVDPDPTGANAFNKFDVNRDGVVNREDAKIVDYFAGKDYRKLADQLGAVLRTDVQSGSTTPAARAADAAGRVFANGITSLDPADPANAGIARRPINLVDVELGDNGTITNANDFKLIHDNLVSLGRLKDGDANLDGSVGFADLGLLLSHYGNPADRWSLGDFNFDGQAGFADLGLLLANYDPGASGLALSLSAYPNLDPGAIALLESKGIDVVPEPGSVGLAGAAAIGLLLRRRRPAARR